MSVKQNLLGLDQKALTDYFVSRNYRPFHAKQVQKWIYKKGVSDFSLMTDLSLSLRSELENEACLTEPVPIESSVSSDGTIKWLLRLVDGNCIECVFIPESDRGTLCISSQVGCSLNCSFCETGRRGFSRNLEVNEIIGQLHTVNRLLKSEISCSRGVSNVVMMGMGEPLLNYKAVVMALRVMIDDNAFGISRRRVTLSTAGLVPAIDRLAKDCPVSLAVSLHSVHDDLRNKLVPLNKKYPINDLLNACKRFSNCDSTRYITFEYVMIDGVNDSVQEARRLADLLKDIPAKVNLIPYNPINGLNYKTSTIDSINRFRDALLEKNLVTITRKTRGDDIAAACGQLAGSFNDRTKRSKKNNNEHPN